MENINNSLLIVDACTTLFVPLSATTSSSLGSLPIIGPALFDVGFFVTMSEIHYSMPFVHILFIVVNQTIVTWNCVWLLPVLLSLRIPSVSLFVVGAL